MACFGLSSGTYLVNGAARSCLYDLEKGLLYSISQEMASFIEKHEGTEVTLEGLSPSERIIIDKLLSNNIAYFFDTSTRLSSIQELKQSIKVNFAWIEVTRQCNLSCTFCYESSDPYCVERMSLSDFRVVLANLIEVGIERIQFIGGEPMILKEELKQMIIEARPHVKFIEVYTNGTFINKDWCLFFKKEDVHVAVSVHSYLPEEHDKVTQQQGSHFKVKRAIQLMQQYEIPYRIGTVETKSCEVGRKSEAEVYELQPRLAKVSGRADLSEFTFDMFKRKAITKDSKRLPLNRQEVIMHISGHQCFSHEVYVSAKLEVYPCVMERRLSYGNLTQRRLKDLIEHPFRMLTKDEIEGCKDCEYRYACFDCRPDSNGKGLYQKPWNCSYNPATGEWADLQEMFAYLTTHNKLASIPIKVESV